MKKRDGARGMNRRDFIKVGMTGAAASLAFKGLGGFGRAQPAEKLV